MVGERAEHEIVGSQHVPLQAVSPQRVEIGLEDPSHHELGQRLPVEAVEEPAHRFDKGGTEDPGRADLVEDEGPSVGDLEGLG